jgi:hypothetical protein
MRAKTVYAKALTPGKKILERDEIAVFQLVLTDRSYQDQDLSNSCNAGGLLVLGAKCTESIGTSLPKSGHDDNPAEAIAVENCLTQMCDCDDAEQNGESYCRGEVWKVHP